MVILEREKSKFENINMNCQWEYFLQTSLHFIYDIYIYIYVYIMIIPLGTVDKRLFKAKSLWHINNVTNCKDLKMCDSLPVSA